jgi:hypothetical protein
MIPTAAMSPDFEPALGQAPSEQKNRSWRRPTADWLRRFLALPELMLVAESCEAEQALHAALLQNPERPVIAEELNALRDDEARANYVVFLHFRDGLIAAGTMEAWYLSQIRAASVSVAPSLLAKVVQEVVHGLLDDDVDAFQARAAELLFRPQRIANHEGRLLSADLAVIDAFNETAGFGELGRLLVQAKAPLPTIEMAVLTAENASTYWARAERHDLLLDLTHEVSNDIGHGISFKLQRTHSGLAALARVLEKWTLHFLGTVVKITPMQRIDDPAWRWHIGLDAQSMALLNDLYEDRPVDAHRQAQLISLFRLDFENPADMRANVAGYPVYLGMATSADGILRLKPQNLLLNLPLAREA